MKRLMTPILIFATIGIVTPAQAQEDGDGESPPHLTVLSYVVPYSNLSAWNALTDSVHRPVLNELVDEGAFLSWGQTVHSWGDEWNVGTYIVSSSHEAFLAGWQKYWQRLNERHEGWFGEVAELFTAHKDNMYTIRYQYSGSE